MPKPQVLLKISFRQVKVSRVAGGLPLAAFSNRVMVATDKYGYIGDSDCRLRIKLNPRKTSNAARSNGSDLVVAASAPELLLC